MNNESIICFPTASEDEELTQESPWLLQYSLSPLILACIFNINFLICLQTICVFHLHHESRNSLEAFVLSSQNYDCTGVVLSMFLCWTEKEEEEEVKQGTRALFHDGSSCYIMDAKSMGNIGRYLNVGTFVNGLLYSYEMLTWSHS